MRFYFDECISPYIARAVKAFAAGARIAVDCALDKFPRDGGGTDPEWLGVLASESRDAPGDGWVVISADPAITKNERNKAAWRESGLTAFFFVGKFANSGPYVQFQEMATRWQEIVRLANESPPGSGFLVYLRGEIRPVYGPQTARRSRP